MRIVLNVSLCVLAATTPWTMEAADKVASDATKSDTAGLQELDDAVETLDPVRQRTEADNDRLHAAALYSAARLYDKQGDANKALRYYQRTVRYDPKNRDALMRLFYLQRRLERHAELARYTVVFSKIREADGLTLLRAFIYLQDQGRLSEAIKLYEKTVAEDAHDNREAVWIELHKLAGESYFIDEQFDAAATAFAIVDTVLTNPAKYGLNERTVELLQGDNPAKLWVLAGEAFLKVGKLERAQATLQRADELNPKLNLKHYAEAQVHAAAGRHPQALDALQAYFDSKATEQGDGPYELFQELLGKQKKKATLIERLQGLVAADPDNHELAYFLANRQIADDQLPAAQGLLEETLRKKPRGSAYRRLFRIYRTSSNVTSMLELVGELVDRTGNLSVLRDELAAAVQEEALIKDLARAARKRLKDEPPGLSFGQSMGVAILASKAAEYDLATEFFEIATSVDAEQTALVYEVWGMDLLRANRYDDAVKVFRRAVDEEVLPAKNPLFHYYLAGALVVEKRYDEALAMARHAADTVANSAEFHGRVAWTLYAADRRQEAIEAYQKLIDRFDADRSSYDVRDQMRDARLLLSHLHTKNGNMTHGVELLEQVLDEFPDDVGAANDLGYLWAEQGTHLNRAHRMIKYAVSAEPDNAAYRDSLGWVLHRLGRPQEALPELKRAADDEQPDGVVLDHLGDVQHSLGQKAEAKESWQRALKVFEEDEDAKMAEKLRDKLKQLGLETTPE